MAFAPTKTLSALLERTPAVVPGVTAQNVIQDGWIEPPAPPKGTTATWPVTYAWPPHYYGPGATLQRYPIVLPTHVAGSSETRFREATVDVTTARTLGQLLVYPAAFNYSIDAAYQHSPITLPLGGGIGASLDYTDNLQIASGSTADWALISFVWRPSFLKGSYQRISIMCLEDTVTRAELTDGLVLPEPSPPFRNNGLRGVISRILRGQPEIGDATEPRAALASAEQIARYLIGIQAITR